MKLINNFLLFCKENRRMLITTGIIFETGLNAYLWYKSGLKISRIKDEETDELSICDSNDKEAIKAVKREYLKKKAPHVILPTITTSLTIGTIIFSHKITTQEILLLTSVASFNKDKLLKTKNKMYEVLGEKKAKEIESLISQDDVNEDKDKRVYSTKYGDVICKDEYSGRYFTSNAIKIKESILKMSSRLITEMFIPLNDLYSDLGLEPIPLGDDLGFSVDQTLNGHIPITFDTVMDDLSNPVLVVSYDITIRKPYSLIHS